MSKKVLFLVNGLGLGNSTRCHAVIQYLKAQHADIHVMTSGNGIWYYKHQTEISKLYEFTPFQYGASNHRLSIRKTLTSLGKYAKIQRENTRYLKTILDSYQPDVVVSDSVYSFKPIKSRHIPYIALNNSDIVHVSYRKFNDKPKSIRAQFYAVEEMDYLYHKRFPDIILSPSLDPELKASKSWKFKRIGPIVRQDYLPCHTPHRTYNVVIMLSGSCFGTEVKIKELHEFNIKIVGRDKPERCRLPDNVTYYGKVIDNYHLLQDADIVVVNGGFSAVSEIFCMRKPMIVVPIPNHAEQWLNARTIKQLGVGTIAEECDIEEAICRSLQNLDEYNNAYKRLGDIPNGAMQAAEEILKI